MELLEMREERELTVQKNDGISWVPSASLRSIKINRLPEVFYEERLITWANHYVKKSYQRIIPQEN